MRRILPFAALSTLTLLAACGPSIKPAMQSATDARIASFKGAARVPAPASYAPKGWKAGQWIAFRTLEGDKPPSVTVLKVLPASADGYVIETEIQDYYGRSVTQAHYRRMPRTGEEAADALTKVVLWKEGEERQEIDFESSPMAGLMKSTMKHVATGVTAPEDVRAQPKETVTVPAGTFEGAAKYDAHVSIAFTNRTVTTWFHPAVPLTGAVKGQDDKGWTYELLGFGETGATSAMP